MFACIITHNIISFRNLTIRQLTSSRNSKAFLHKRHYYFFHRDILDLSPFRYSHYLSYRRQCNRIGNILKTKLNHDILNFRIFLHKFCYCFCHIKCFHCILLKYLLFHQGIIPCSFSYTHSHSRVRLMQAYIYARNLMRLRLRSWYSQVCT